MNYTIKKDVVIFELPLSDYLGKRYNRGQADSWINSMQEYEEYIFDTFESFFPYITKDDFQWIDKNQAIDYLKSLSENYTAEELALFSEDIDADILTALTYAKDNSYQDEWIKKFMKETQKRIDADLAENFDGIDYNLIDRLNSPDYWKERAESDHLRLEISNADIKKWLKDNYRSEKYHLEKDYVDFFNDYALDFDRKPINTEYIDQYGTMGDFDQWLDYFKDYQETSSKIDEYRKDEQAKINNFALAYVNTLPLINQLADYVNQYIDKEPQKSKIIRQIDALKNLIKKCN